MVFNFSPVNIALIFISLWSLLLSFFLWQIRHHYNKLTKGISNKTLKVVLEKMLEDDKVSQKKIEELISRCVKIEAEGLLHIQRIGLVRFNPFKDTGGDQSFVLAILDGRNNGIVISSLHGRTGNRWYAKTVIEGKGKEHSFSEEEEKAVKQARTL